jgi:hypothetical protein
MKWEKYSKLTPAQKEEYNFRFGNKEILPHVKGMNFTLLILFSFILSIMCLSLVMIKVEGFETYKVSVQTIMENCVTISAVMGFIMLMYLIYDLISIIIHWYKLYKWKKQNQIK